MTGWTRRRDDPHSAHVIESYRLGRSAGRRRVPRGHGAPRQNPFAERVIGSIRRERLDHVLVLNARHLRRLLRGCPAYYNTTGPHQALANNSPHPR